MTAESQATISWGMRKKQLAWEVLRLKSTPAAFVGVVHAPDEKRALETAIKELNIRPEDQNRLLVRRH
jgi:1,2-phenylacetyl-CoA epoxidase PaaB subunit